jgi:hypothetical protein
MKSLKNRFTTLTSNTKLFLKLFFLLCLALTFTIYSSYIRNTPDKKEIHNRQAFAKLTGLPDLSIYLDKTQSRHRSLTSIHKIYSADPFAIDTDFASMVYTRPNIRR